MATKMTCTYLGDGQTELVHGPTNTKLITDLPPDNGGKGRGFSPTDIFAASLPACIVTIMGELAKRNNEDLKGLKIEFEKEMQSSPRRVGKIILKITFPERIPAESRKKYMASIKACPVHGSLHPEIVLDISER
jgi:putative redox protein